VIAFVHEEIAVAGKMLATDLPIPDDAKILGHYRNRRVVPLDIASDLTAEQQAVVKASGRHELVIRSVPLRHYPNGELGAHFLGYTGRAHTNDAASEGLIDTDAREGREGLELVFDGELAGKRGIKNIQIDPATGNATENISESPQAGRSVVTTIDAQLQTWCEAAFKTQARRGAMVILDPNTGDVLALASWPSYDPNRFTPFVTQAYFRSLNEDAALPLVDRATRGLYPPGAIFKIFSGLAAVESGAVKVDEKLPNPSSLQFGAYTFRDWKNIDRGSLTFSEALAQNGDTWFYQAGVRTGAQSIVEWASKFGFGRKTGISLHGETTGILPTDEFLSTKAGKDWKGWDEPSLANLAVGQGYVMATPLEVAQAMATLGNGGTVYQVRIGKQLKEASGKVAGEYAPKREAQLVTRPEVLNAIREAMVARVNEKGNAAAASAVDGVSVAGQTASTSGTIRGTAVTYGWFAGFAPAHHPEYAFACVCEGDKEDAVSGGATAAPIVGKVLREVFANRQR
jgi:penicillin-binding protein 2